METITISFPGLARLLHGLDCADSHIVVVREEGIDLLACVRQQPLHDLVALVAEEIAVLRGDDAVIRVVFYHFLEPDGPVDGWGGAYRTL